MKEPGSPQTLRGRVKWFNNQKGYGFIVREGDPDIFVHYSAVQMEGYRTLRQGDEVCFQMEQGTKGLHATNVVPMK